MNADRRKRIAEIATMLEAIKDDLFSVQEEEQSAFDNMPEGLQASEKGQQSEEKADSLQQAVDDLDSIVDSLNEVAS